MKEKLFKSLREELRKDHGITKKSIPFVPFEDWRTKLRTYPLNFPEEYDKNLSLLKRKLGLTGLEEVKNPNKKLILFVGVPGAGKTALSHVIQREIPNTVLIRGHDVVDFLELFGKKEDLYRERLRQRRFTNPDPWYISYLYQDLLTRDCLNKGHNVVFDDHIRTRRNRLGYYVLSRECNAKIVFVQINAPFKTYLEREEGNPSKKKVNFLANFVFQSQDFSAGEKREYDGIIEVDGNSKLGDIEKSLVSQIHKL